jgi:hypothetical protein
MDGEAWRAIDAVEGWFTRESFVLWNALLKRQRPSGALMEIGVFQGRSASALERQLREGERLILCDPLLEHGIPAALGGTPPERLVVLPQSSSTLCGAPELAEHRGRVRFLSVDGDHSGVAVYNDLKLADELLAPGGVVALDDFFSPQYPQVTAATYRYLDRHPYSFVMMLVGFHKAYLCRPAAYLAWQSFIVQGLAEQMEAAGVAVSLCKTSSPEDNLTFGLYPLREDLGPRNGRFRLIGETNLGQ